MGARGACAAVSCDPGGAGIESTTFSEGDVGPEGLSVGFLSPENRMLKRSGSWISFNI